MSRKSTNWGFYTRAIHAGFSSDQHRNARAVPIYQTTAYTFNDTDHAARLFKMEEPGYIYTRLNNPTVDVFERRMANLEGGDCAVAFASGMSAISSTLLALVHAGDEIVSSASLYGGTFNLFSTTLARFGIRTHFVESTDYESFEKAITDKTRVLYVETIGNPKIDVPDLEALADIAHARNLPLVVDNTVATPCLCRPFEHGADLVVHSASKYIGGHGAALGGVVISGGSLDWPRSFPALESYAVEGESPVISAIRAETLRDFGGALAPMNAFLLAQGLETLALRMERHCDNASRLAAFLSSHPAVEYVNYPTVSGYPCRNNAEKYLPAGYSSLLSFGLKGGFAAGKRLVDGCRMIHHLANLGDTKTLILHPASTSHEPLTPEQRLAAGAPDELIRMSVGLENFEDIVADLERGLTDASE